MNIAPSGLSGELRADPEQQVIAEIAEQGWIAFARPLVIDCQPVHGEFVITLRLASGTDRGNGTAKRNDQGRHGPQAPEGGNLRPLLEVRRHKPVTRHNLVCAFDPQAR
jgi:hypothetical protein